MPQRRQPRDHHDSAAANSSRHAVDDVERVTPTTRLRCGANAAQAPLTTDAAGS